MIAGRHPLIAFLVLHAMRRSVLRHFNAVRLCGDKPDIADNTPVIICSNHTSWWDPALFAFLQQYFFGTQQGFGPIDAQALKQYPLLGRAGLIPLDPNDFQSIRRFLKTSEHVLNSKHILWITAQGRFVDSRVRPIELEPGIAHLIKRIPGVSVIPLGIEYVFWSESRPEALLQFGAPLKYQDFSKDSINDIRKTIEDALTTTMDTLAKKSLTRDPDCFKILERGSAGIGGIYDSFRRLHAWSQGHKFQARHTP
ncbi:lysophospholipid acyltransferase family protein [Kozakia baliensis]|uniref:lysophospholipid acyltransferase family protein n=1 Tax=Kozakia baliensis TaxID=153496 RepID=UPI001D037B7C|nr:lysophospholipid acyltransferase family protein [Kozakia baliensis]